MDLAIGNLEYKGRIKNVLNSALEIEPLGRIFTEVRYLEEKMVIPKISKNVREFALCQYQTMDTKETYLSGDEVLRANKGHVPEGGRLLIFTSYALIEGTGRAHGTASYGIRSKNPELRRLEDKFLLFDSAIVTNRGLTSLGETADTVAHELGHTFGLKHEKDDHYCIMSGRGFTFQRFCENCRKELDIFIS